MHKTVVRFGLRIIPRIIQSSVNVIHLSLRLRQMTLTSLRIINNYWMRLSMMSRIIQTEVNVIYRSRRLRWITLTEVWIIPDTMRKPNPIIVLLYIQNSDRCKKRFSVKRLVCLTVQTARGHFCYFVTFALLRWLRHQRPVELQKQFDCLLLLESKISRQL